jgi:hypothetical protein
MQVSSCIQQINEEISDANSCGLSLDSFVIAPIVDFLRCCPFQQGMIVYTSS